MLAPPFQTGTCFRLVMLGLVFVSSARAIAQESGPRFNAALAGTVMDSLGRPIPHAMVLIGKGDVAAISDDSGRFHLTGAPSGLNAFTIMRIGFRPVSFETTLAVDTTIVIAVTLKAIPTLEAVEVRASRLAERLARVGFFERMHRGRGTYITSQRIDSISFGAKSSSLLRDVRGIDIKCPPMGGATCAVVTRSAPQCLWLFVDGHYTDSQIDDMLPPTAIAAIEVYERPAMVPLEFHGPLPRKQDQLTVAAGCGALVVWTKARVGAP